METPKSSRKVLETVRSEWPKISLVLKGDKKQYMIDSRKTGYNGSLQFRPTKEKAEERAKEILADFEQEGLAGGGAIDSTLRVYALKANDILKPYGKSVLQAAEFFRDHLEAEKAKVDSRIIGTLADEWLTDKESNTREVLRDNTIKGIKKGVKFLKTHWADTRIKALAVEEITKEVDKKPSVQTRKNMLSLVSQFFNWCIQKNIAMTILATP